MAGGKQYKNVYTILEKVKKGEIKSHYNNEGGLFGKLKFYKKPDLVKPYLHYIDENRLDSIMDTYMNDTKMVSDHYTQFAKTTAFKKIEEGNKPDVNGFYKNFKKNYANFPKHIAKDIFKMYYNKIENLDFEERTEQNHTKFKFLEKANNPVGKIMSEKSNLKSAIFARNILGYFIARMTMMDYIDQDASNSIKNGMNGESDFDNDGVDKALQKAFDTKDGKDMLNKAVEDAQNLCKEMDNVMDKDVQEKMFEAANEPGENKGASKLSPDYVRIVAAHLENIKMSMGSLKEKIKKLLDKSANYFSSKKETVYEDLFNAEDISGLEDYELLHPKLRKIFAEDLQVKETKAIGRIDIYIDRSGSMSGHCGIKNSENRYISRIDFCKAFTAKLKGMDLLNNVYTFDSRVRQSKNDIISISMLDCGGGTTIDAAIRHINKEGRNALIITDAEDRCSIYSDKAFFIGLKGANFNYFDEDIIKEYSNKGQVVIFNGENIVKVDQYGNAQY
jgi:hypothetical protein